MTKKESKCIFTEQLQKKISIFSKKKITSDKKYQIRKKTTSERKKTQMKNTNFIIKLISLMKTKTKC